MTNLCRDEVTTVLKDKIDQAFGCSFNTNGLGAVLTCGLTGIKAGLSHAPVAMVRAGGVALLIRTVNIPTLCVQSNRACIVA